MLVAGEASGDMYGSHLAHALKSESPGIRLFGLGGTLMRQAGVKILYDATSMSSIGFTESMKSVMVLRRVLQRLEKTLDLHRPDVLVLIDFADFNMRLAQKAHRKGIPVIYYFSPSAWAWRKRRAFTVAKHAAKVCAVLPAEAEVYGTAGADVTYVGHPLIDIAKPTTDKERLRADWDIKPDQRVIGLLPGSRRQELKNHFLPLVGAAKQLVKNDPNTFFLLGAAHTVSSDWLDPDALSGLPHRVVTGRSYDVLHAADAAICAMGTVTLEAAIIDCPIVALYRTSPSNYFILRQLYKGRHVALSNIILGYGNVPELLQSDVTPNRIANEVEAVLKPNRTEDMRRRYGELKSILGGPGASLRTARKVLEIAGGNGDERDG